MDNSDWMRNGDFTPSRIEAQYDSLTLIFRAKTGCNPENTVGAMTMASDRPKVLVTLTSDMGKFINASHNVGLKGCAKFSTGIQIATLTLKHRQNKVQRQRIVVFVGSPIEDSQDELVKLAKKLKKNNISIDIINFGQVEENRSKLDAFISSVDSAGNSHIIHVEPNNSLLSDIILSSEILATEGGGAPNVASNADYEFGVDPNLDPELALALRISMEEEKARQEALSGGEKDEGTSRGPEAMEVDEDEEVKRAIELSLQDNQQDSETMMDALDNLPGVDPNDPKVKDALNKKDKK